MVHTMGSIVVHQALLCEKLLCIQSIWAATFGEELVCDSEHNNDRDMSAVTVLTRNSHRNNL